MRHSGWRRRLTDCRRWVFLMGMRGAVQAGRYLSPEGARTLGRVTGQLAGSIAPLRERLAGNLRRAGIEPTPARLDRYFRRFGCWVGWSAATYNHGFQGAGLADRILFDSSIVHVDRAIAKGRGIIFACPHGFCYELGAAA